MTAIQTKKNNHTHTNKQIVRTP